MFDSQKQDREAPDPQKVECFPIFYTLLARAYPTEYPPPFALNELIINMLCFFNIFVHAYIHICALCKVSKLCRKRKDLHRKKSKLSTFRNKNIHHHILLFLISPTYDYHAERLISTQLVRLCPYM